MTTTSPDASQIEFGLAAAGRVSDAEQPIVAQRDRHDRPGKIGFVAILVQTHSRAFRIVVDQAAIRQPRARHKRLPDLEYRGRDVWPFCPIRVAIDIAVARPVREPSVAPGGGHANRHRLAVGCLRRKKRCRLRDGADRIHKLGLHFGIQIALVDGKSADHQACHSLSLNVVLTRNWKDSQKLRDYDGCRLPEASLYTPRRTLVKLPGCTSFGSGMP